MTAATNEAADPIDSSNPWKRLKKKPTNITIIREQFKNLHVVKAYKGQRALLFFNN